MLERVTVTKAYTPELAIQTAALRRSPESAEMLPWHVPGPYNGPIARRIVEDAGVPRSMFAVEKKAASVLLFQRSSFLSAKSLVDIDAWYHDHFRGARYASDLGLQLMQRTFSAMAQFGQSTSGMIARATPSKTFQQIARSSRINEMGNHQTMNTHLLSLRWV